MKYIARTKVGPGVFEQALEQSLRSVGLLSPNPKDARYGLTGKVQKVDQPYFGGNMTVTVWTEYILLDRSSEEEVLRTIIAVLYTAKLVGAERLRLATEGAVRENITKLIDDLFTLNLTPAASRPVQVEIVKSNEEKLRELKRLNDSGLISKEVYLDQQRSILSKP